MSSADSDPVSEKATEAAARLRIDAATAEVLGAFEAAGLRSRILKGPALADWYAPGPVPSYLDSDLWVHPDDLIAAEHELRNLSFVPDFDEGPMPDWWLEHAGAWSRQIDMVTVDLHRTLQGIGVDVRVAWAVLCDPPDEIEVAGRTASRLPEAARALYVTLHAAHHGQAWGKSLAHLTRALEVLVEPVWREAADLARRVGAIDAFAAGLRLVPAGAELAAQLGLSAPASVKVLLHAETPPPTALGFAQLADAAGPRQRLRILFRKLFPPPAFIRHWWAPAGRGPLMLIVGYAYRPVWLIQRARRGLPAWWRARARARR